MAETLSCLNPLLDEGKCLIFNPRLLEIQFTLIQEIRIFLRAFSILIFNQNLNYVCPTGKSSLEHRLSGLSSL